MVEWKTYGGNLASNRYAPLDQINPDNSRSCKWPGGSSRMRSGRGRTSSIRRRRCWSGACSTPPPVRAVRWSPWIRDGEIRWLHRDDRADRGRSRRTPAPGRGVSYWSSADGSEQRIMFVTPGYRMIALNAKTGMPFPASAVAAWST